MTMLFWWMKTGKYLCVFCVEVLALRNKKEKNEVEGRRVREWEETSKKKKGGGSERKFEWFLCTRRKIGERQTRVLFKVEILSSVAAHIFLPRPDFPISHHHSPMQGMKGHEMWAVVHRHCAAELLVHDASRGNLDAWCAYTCMALIAVYWRGSPRCPRRSSWSQLWEFGTANDCSQLRTELHLSRRTHPFRQSTRLCSTISKEKSPVLPPELV